jgi:hypothetical protein
MYRYRYSSLVPGRYCVEMNSQSRIFVKQVQVDLLALSDTELNRTIHQWVDGEDTYGQYAGVPEDTLRALGYIRVPDESESGSHLSIDGSEAAQEMPVVWQPPSPDELRALLTAMDVNVFARHVIALAYQSLHAQYPEWYDGLTFNAHLANYLRQMHLPSRPVDIATTRNPHPTR